MLYRDTDRLYVGYGQDGAELTIDQYDYVYNPTLEPTAGVQQANNQQPIIKAKITPDQFVNDSTDISSKPCVICQVNKKRCVILDCFHVVVCIRCAFEIQNKECPVCRTKITDIRITYD